MKRLFVFKSGENEGMIFTKDGVIEYVAGDKTKCFKWMETKTLDLIRPWVIEFKIEVTEHSAYDMIKGLFEALESNLKDVSKQGFFC